MIGKIDSGISSHIQGVRCASAIYFLWQEGRIVYAGQSVNVLKRICEHCVDKFFDRSTFEPVHANDLTFVESYAIWFFRPQYNKHVPMLGSLGCNYSGKLKRASIDFVCHALRATLTQDQILDRFAEADERLEFHASKTSSRYYSKTLRRQIKRNHRVRDIVMCYVKEATDGTAQS